MACLVAVVGLDIAVLPAAAADKVVVVQAGDTLSEIALERGVSVAQLVALNGIKNPGLIYIGQRLRVQAAPPPAAPVPVVHVVASGENLTVIAHRYGTSISSIVTANGISNPSFLRVGQRLTIPGVAAAAPAARSAPVPVVHVVASGENLTVIAHRYGTSIASIVTANGISNPSFLRVGQRLTIPGVAAAAPASVRGTGLPTAMAAAVTSRASVGSLIAAEATAAGIDPAFALAVAWQESGWRHEVVSSAGAIGVMQLMPATGDWVASLLGEAPNVHDLHWNVHAGVRLLAHYLDRYHGDRSLALAAYYQGERATDIHGIYAVSRPYVASILALQAIFSR
jgi:LysM repeat protein